MSWVYQPFTTQPDSGPTIVEADGSSAGVSTVAAIAVAFFLTTGSVAGLGTPDGIGVAFAQAVGNAAGSSTATATLDTSANGLSEGLSSVIAQGGAVIGNVGAGAGIADALGVGGYLNQGVGVAIGTSTTAADGIIVAIATRGNANGVATGNAQSHVIAGSVGTSHGIANVTAASPSSLVPQSFKPIEQRRIKLPKLPRGLPPEQWIDIATREFDSFFNDLHHYLSSNTFVNGVHTEILGQNFTLTPETSTIFVTANEAVVSDPLTAIKNVTNVPRYFTIVNTGLFPITLKDDANTRFGGDDIILGSGRIITLIYTGEAWVGNAI